MSFVVFPLLGSGILRLEKKKRPRDSMQVAARSEMLYLEYLPRLNASCISWKLNPHTPSRRPKGVERKTAAQQLWFYFSCQVGSLRPYTGGTCKIFSFLIQSNNWKLNGVDIAEITSIPLASWGVSAAKIKGLSRSPIVLVSKEPLPMLQMHQPKRQGPDTMLLWDKRRWIRISWFETKKNQLQALTNIQNTLPKQRKKTNSPKVKIKTIKATGCRKNDVQQHPPIWYLEKFHPCQPSPRTPIGLSKIGDLLRFAIWLGCLWGFQTSNQNWVKWNQWGKMSWNLPFLQQFYSQSPIATNQWCQIPKTFQVFFKIFTPKQ